MDHMWSQDKDWMQVAGYQMSIHISQGATWCWGRKPCVCVCVFSAAQDPPASLLRTEPHSLPSLMPLLKTPVGSLEPKDTALAASWYLTVGGWPAMSPGEAMPFMPCLPAWP